MSPFLKGLLVVIGGIVVLVIAAVVTLALTFDPNDYKGQIQAQVRDNTGRELQLSGPLSLTIFPWLGVQAENVRLANAEGFTDPDMASLRRLDARLAIWPLFSGQVEIGKIVIDGLSLNLERRADGSTNWDDLGAGDEAADGEEPQDGPDPRDEASTDAQGDLSGLHLAGVEITDARLQWRDGDQVTVIEGLNLETGPIAEGEASDLRFSVAISLADQTRIDVELTTGWQFALSGPSAALDGSTLRVQAAGPAVPGGEQQMELALNALYDGALQRASIDGGELQFAGQKLLFSGQVKDLAGAQLGQLQLEGKTIQVDRLAKALELALPPEAASWPDLNLVVEAETVLGEGRVPSVKLGVDFGELALSADASLSKLDTPEGKGNLSVEPLDLHAFLERLGYGLAKSESPGATHLDLDWALASDALVVPQIKGALAGEALSGKLSVKQLSAKVPAIRADLELAALRLADWQGQGGGESAERSEKKSGGLNEMEVPMDWARNLNLTARAAIRQLNVYGVKFNDVIWTADARPAQPVKQTLRANAYGGQLSMDNQIDATKAEPQVGLNFAAKAVGLGDFLQDGWGSRWITGTTELGASLQSHGTTVGQLRQGANGEANYRLKDGEVQGVSLLDVLRKASASLQGETHQAGAEQTSFSELFGRAVVESGKLKMREFGGDNSWLKLAGDGFVDLLEGRYDLKLSPQLLDNEQTRQDKYLSRLVGLAIPVSVTGPLAAPKFKVDLEQLAKEKARSKLQEKEGELKDKLEEKLGDLFRKR